MCACAQPGTEPDLGMRIQLVHGDEVIVQKHFFPYRAPIHELTAQLPTGSSSLLGVCFVAASAHLTCHLAGM